MTMNTKTHSDIKPDKWIEKFCPETFKPYAYLARLDRPIGIWLLLLPALWSIALAAPSLNAAVKPALLFAIGAIIMRSAGCTVNDLWDRNLDRQVIRTKTRPLASGRISPRHAFFFLIALLLAGALILFQFNMLTILLGCLSLPLIAAYPLMKRITWWPQAFLGLTFNFGALMGWSAMTGQIGSPAVLLYVSGIFWTLAYDTIYAHQDMEDDALAGIKSTALKFGSHSKLWVIAFFMISLICAGLSLLYINLQYVPFLIFAGAHILWQLRTWDVHSVESALKTFKANKTYGMILLASIILARYLSG